MKFTSVEMVSCPHQSYQCVHVVRNVPKVSSTGTAAVFLHRELDGSLVPEDFVMGPHLCASIPDGSWSFKHCETSPDAQVSIQMLRLAGARHKLVLQHWFQH